VQDASNASPVNLSSAIVDLNQVVRRRSIENARSADAVITGFCLLVCLLLNGTSALFRPLAKWSELQAVKYNVM